MQEGVFIFKLSSWAKWWWEGKGREPYLAWNWELADLMENREIYKESGIAYGFYTPLAPPDSKGVLLF